MIFIKENKALKLTDLLLLLCIILDIRVAQWLVYLSVMWRQVVQIHVEASRSPQPQKWASSSFQSMGKKGHPGVMLTTSLSSVLLGQGKLLGHHVPKCFYSMTGLVFFFSDLLSFPSQVYGENTMPIFAVFPLFDSFNQLQRKNKIQMW